VASVVENDEEVGTPDSAPSADGMNGESLRPGPVGGAFHFGHSPHVDSGAGFCDVALLFEVHNGHGDVSVDERDRHRHSLPRFVGQ
jgi:hypothetical protein